MSKIGGLKKNITANTSKIADQKWVKSGARSSSLRPNKSQYTSETTLQKKNTIIV